MSFHRYIFLLLLMVHTNAGFAQTKKSSVGNWQKYGLVNTQLYFFRLADGIKNEDLIAKVVNEKFNTLSERMHLNGKLISRKNEFVYVAKRSNILYGQKLPFFIPVNTWVFVFNYSDQYLLIDNASKIQISAKNKALASKWQLPVTFDMREDIALSFDKYLKTSAQNIDASHIPRLSLSEKVDLKTTIADTTLVYSIKKLPKGIPLLINDIDLKPHANQEFNLKNAMFYRKELFFYIPIKAEKKPIIVKNYPDQCSGKMTDINGNIGYASGCITGLGSGKCSGILASRATKKYNVTIIIEPN